MTTNELRLGNLLNGKNGHVLVKSIDVKGFVRIEDNSSFFNVQGDFPCLEPIPLTEEWLEWFGFEKNKIKHQIGDFECHRIGGGKWNFVWDKLVLSASLKHVHSLQNLYFSLTGEELNLNQ